MGLNPKSHRRRREECQRKIGYASFRDAAEAMTVVRKAGKLRAGEASPYKCPYCEWWHWGHLTLSGVRRSDLENHSKSSEI